MHAIEISRPGGPEVLRLAEVPAPSLSGGDVRIAVKAAGVSRADVLQRKGLYPPPPGASEIPGLDVAGTIVETSGASPWKSGDEVCALLAGGGYAEEAATPHSLVLPIPANWSFTEAATLPENFFTVYDNLVTRARFHAGERLLVHGGTSGIGTTAIMLARALGAGFIAATAGSKEKCAACIELGADIAIDYKNEDFVAAVKSATNDRGVDVILDIVGASYIARNLEAAAADGRIVCVATQGGSRAELDLAKLLQRRLTIIGSSLRSRTVEQKAGVARAVFENVWALLPARSPIRPVVDSTFPLEQATEAHRRMESSEHIGKIVLVM